MRKKHKVIRDKFTAVGAPMSIYYCEEFDPKNFDAEIAILYLLKKEMKIHMNFHLIYVQ